MSGEDRFPCAVGSEAPANIILSNEAKRRCPLCHHMAGAHDPEREGTCDTCEAVRLTTNTLVLALASRGIDLSRPPVVVEAVDTDERAEREQEEMLRERELDAQLDREGEERDAMPDPVSGPMIGRALRDEEMRPVPPMNGDVKG